VYTRSPGRQRACSCAARAARASAPRGQRLTPAAASPPGTSPAPAPAQVAADLVGRARHEQRQERPRQADRRAPPEARARRVLVPQLVLIVVVPGGVDADREDAAAQARLPPGRPRRPARSACAARRSRGRAHARARARRHPCRRRAGAAWARRGPGSPFARAERSLALLWAGNSNGVVSRARVRLSAGRLGAGACLLQRAIQDRVLP